MKHPKNQSAHTDAMRRHVAAIHFVVSGPSRIEPLDTVHVVVGAGPPIPEEFRQAQATGLVRQRRCMVYLEFAEDALTPARIHVVEPHAGGIAWFENCVLWTAGDQAEVAIVATEPGTNSTYVSRGGVLLHESGRPDDLAEGMERADVRMATVVRNLQPRDLEGQTATQTPIGETWWQKQGFRIRG